MRRIEVQQASITSFTRLTGRNNSGTESAYKRDSSVDSLNTKLREHISAGAPVQRNCALTGVGLEAHPALAAC